MKKLTKKQSIIIGIAVAIIAIVVIILGVYFGTKTPDTKKENKDKVEQQNTDKTNKENKETAEDKDTDKNKDEQPQQTQNAVEEESKQETPQQQQQGSSNTNTNPNNNNNSGGTTPSTSTPNPTPEPVPEKSPYAGMYTLMDEASKTRFVTCGNILRGGLAGQYIQVTETFIDYFNGNIVMINGTTDDAWMYLCIAGWSTNIGSAETAPIYDELPSLAKQCMETIAPDGGTDLYNTINSLIMQYGGARYVPTQGRISESIPGLYVTVTQGRSGLEIEFWAE